MNECFQEQGTGLAVMSVGVEGGAEPSFEHAEDGFDLSALRVGFVIEVARHAPAIAAERQFFGRSAVLRGNDRADAEYEPRGLMDPLGVEPGVGQETRDRQPPPSLRDGRLPTVGVRRRTAAGRRRQDEMTAAIANDCHLRERAIGRRLPFSGKSALFRAPTDEVFARAMRFEAAGVDRLRANAAGNQSPASGPRDRLVEHVPHALGAQQAPRSLLQRGVVRHAIQLQHFAQRGLFEQQRLHAAIVASAKLLEHQTGEQPMLRERLRATTMRIRRQRSSRRLQRHLQHPRRTLTRLAHTLSYEPTAASGLSRQERFSTEPS